VCKRILTWGHSTGQKRLKRSEPLLLELWIVILPLFVLFFQCGHLWAFWRTARHDPTRVVSAKTNIHFGVQSNSENRPHTLADSTCTAVRNNTNTACQFAAAYTDDCDAMCAPNALASTPRRTHHHARPRRPRLNILHSCGHQRHAVCVHRLGALRLLPKRGDIAHRRTPSITPCARSPCAAAPS